MSHRAYIGMGSNIEPVKHLLAAVVELSKLGELERVSQVYESTAVGDVDQPKFLNAAALLRTDQLVEPLCESLREVETQLGRKRDPGNKNAARTIDLDLVLYDECVLKVGHRRIPDPDILERAFLAVPLSEVDPEFVHPETGESLREIANRLSAKGTDLKEQPEIDLRLPQNCKRC